jgi:guanylate kinase
MVETGALLEHALVFGNRYGTPRAAVEQMLGAGRDVLFDIDWQGTEQLSSIEGLKEDLVRVFVLPPSFEELRSRLERRAEDSVEVISNRLANAVIEMRKWQAYDYVIVNADLERSLAAVRAILTAERLRRERTTGLGEFVDGLLAEAREINPDPGAAGKRSAG